VNFTRAPERAYRPDGSWYWVLPYCEDCGKPTSPPGDGKSTDPGHSPDWNCPQSFAWCHCHCCGKSHYVQLFRDES
jgi:hypothetical protein